MNQGENPTFMAEPPRTVRCPILPNPRNERVIVDEARALAGPYY
jgi:hypothetical protein